jgi:hypothetical protein
MLVVVIAILLVASVLYFATYLFKGCAPCLHTVG